MAHSDDVVGQWLERILDHEGGFTDNPHDPGNWTGGEIGVGLLKGTKWGIAANSWPELDIQNLTRDEAVAIYRQNYLDPLDADRYSDGVAFQLLDLAINSGVWRAKTLLQRAVGAKEDGIIGPVTMSKMYAFSESDLIMLIISTRLDYLTNLNAWPKFSRGWVRRIATNLRYGVLDS